MKALSVRQPFPYLILTGRKTIETRSWATVFRGPLLITSSLQLTQKPKVNLGMEGIWDTYFYWGSPKRLYQYFEAQPFGTMHCIVDVVDCRLSTPEDCVAACVVSMDTYAWILSTPRPVEMRLVKGRMRLFDVPDAQIVFCNNPLDPAPAPEKETTP